MYIFLGTAFRSSALEGLGRVLSSVFWECLCVLLMAAMMEETVQEISGDLVVSRCAGDS